MKIVNRFFTIHHSPFTIHWRAMRPAFTLIELLVVMGIIAVLAGAVLYATDNAREKGRDKARKDTLEAIRTGSVAYYADHKEFPTFCYKPGDTPIPGLKECKVVFTTDGVEYLYTDSATDLTGWQNAPGFAPYFKDGKVPVDPNQLTSQIKTTATGLASLPGKIAGWFTSPSGGLSNQNGQVAGITTGNFGNTNIGSTIETPHNNVIKGTKFTMGANTATSNTIKAYIAGTIDTTPGKNSFKVALYENDTATGRPKNLIASATGTIDTPGEGWRTVTLGSSVGLDANTSYWLVYINNADSETKNNLKHDTTGTTDAVYNYQSFSAALPTGAVWGTLESPYNYSIYMPYSSPDTIISCEAENFTLNPSSGAYTVIDPGPDFKASGSYSANGGAIWRPNAGQSDTGPTDPGLGKATKTISVNTGAGGTYYFWARTRYELGTASDDSFWLKINNGSYFLVGAENDPGGAPSVGQEFHWVNFVNNDNNSIISATLSEGNNTLELRVNEDGNKIDKILLVNDANFVPSNISPFGPAEQNCTGGGGPPTTCTDPAATNYGEEGACIYPPEPPTEGIPEGDTECENACRIGNQTRADKKWFRLWVFLENPSDPQRVEGPGGKANGDVGPNSVCTASVEVLNIVNPVPKQAVYCIESPPI